MSSLVNHNEVLDQMRTAFSGKEGYGMLLNDSTFMRYLRARNHNFEKARDMLEATITWRKEMGVKDMLANWTETLCKENETGKMYVRCYDKDGHVILHMKPQYENTKNHEGNIKNLVFTLEKACACMARNTVDDVKLAAAGVLDLPPAKQEKLMLIVDFDGYSMFNAPPLKTSLETLTILQSHYPERLYKAYLVHPPWIFMTFWNIVYPLIDPVTQQKVQFMKCSTHELRDQLAQVVDVTALDAYLGGDNQHPFDANVYIKGDLDLDYNAICAVNSNSK